MSPTPHFGLGIRMTGAILAWLAGAVVSAPPGNAADVRIEARFGQSRLAVGESTPLELVVRGGQVQGDPQFELPAGLELLSSGRTQSFSWINGRHSAETVFRYEIGAVRAGRFEVGPIDVRVAGSVYRSNRLTLEADAAARRVNESGDGPASIVVELEPPNPYVGQEILMRVRLIQRAAFAEDPQYTPPPTVGFWSERASSPESYYAEESGRRVLVTETRTRLYPVAVGEATVGEAVAVVVVPERDRTDPLNFLGGSPRRELLVRSAPVGVRVRRLPRGAPEGFEGAVGNFEVSWSADRDRTARDAPISLRLDVRGRGNLPLMRGPHLAQRELEVFASTAEESLGAPGSRGVGRKRFQWTVLPRAIGSLEIPSPAFAWFDPAQGEFRIAEPRAVRVEVGPPIGAAAGPDAVFPASLRGYPLEPGKAPIAPWPGPVIGVLLGGAFALLRRDRSASEPVAPAAQTTLIAALRASSGEAFWRAAEQSVDWLERHHSSSSRTDEGLSALRAQVRTVRYGGGTGSSETLRRPLLERMERALPQRPARGLRPALGIGLALAAIALGVFWWMVPTDLRVDRAWRQADGRAVEGDLDEARSRWAALWSSGIHHPALAARLAWYETQRGAIGPASLWVARGELESPRDHALAWVARRVREAGGLVGSDAFRIPLTGFEWGLLGVAAGACVVPLIRRRWLATALLALALITALADPVQSWLARGSRNAVVLDEAQLEGTDLELQPGQVVKVEERSGNRARVQAGRTAAGWVSTRSIGFVSGS